MDNFFAIDEIVECRYELSKYCRYKIIVNFTVYSELFKCI